MCYVPTKGEGETNVSSKFVDDSSAVYKTGEMHQVLQFWAMRQTWATDGDLGTENIKMIVDILQVNEITQKTMQNEKKWPTRRFGERQDLGWQIEGGNRENSVLEAKGEEEIRESV